MTTQNSMSSKKTAHTEKIVYSTTYCHICGTEVATDLSPPDVPEPRGYAVVLGEGQIENRIEDKGNWDEEYRFALNKEHSSSPKVQGCVICENCASAVHDFNVEGRFIGSIPNDIRLESTNSDQGPDSENILYLLMLFVLIVVLILVLAL